MDLKKVIEENTVDGVVDYEKVMATIDNDYVNPIVAKKTDKEKLLPEAIKEIVAQLGIEASSIDDVKLYVKKMGGSTDEFKEANIKLEKELAEYKANYEREVEARATLENETKTAKQINLVRSLGVTDDTELEFLHYKFNKAVTEEKPFETVVAEYAKENGVKTSTVFVKDDFSNPTGTIDIGEVWKEQRKKSR